MDGILNIYKEAGFTSHDVVARLRGILQQKILGHTGTLDPDAVGVLPVCCGKATKVCELLTDHDKTYVAVCQLGIETDTQDTSGNVLVRRSCEGITAEQIIRTAEKFVGDILQIPPMYSAIKVHGKKLYELAREGKTVERKARPVTIRSLRIQDINQERGQFTMEVTCSKGTYIRTLCHDIGQRIGCGAAMAHLTRTRVGRFTQEDAVTLEQLQQCKDQAEDFEDFLRQVRGIAVAVDRLFTDCPEIRVTGEEAGRLQNGNPFEYQKYLSRDALSEGQDVRVYDEQGCFKALYYRRGQLVFVRKMF